MEHLKFVDELQKLGVRISSTNVEGRTKEYPIYGLFKTDTIIEKGFQLKWKEHNSEIPIRALLKKAVDVGQWKHSWHIEMTPENYEKIEEIIQKHIIERAKEIDELMSIYFQLHYEQSQIETEAKSLNHCGEDF